MKTPLKRAVIKEELVELTGSWAAALILNQFLYWSDRTRDTDKYLEEEKNRAKGEDGTPLTHGWIYKKAEELSAELMIGMAPTTIRTYVKNLVAFGWLDERHNPHHTWDRTLQYRPNVHKIQQDLQQLGYSLEGYALVEYMQPHETEDASSESEDRSSESEDRSSESEEHYQRLLTQTTSKTTLSVKIEKFADEVIETWNTSFQEFCILSADGRTTMRTDKKVLSRLENGKLRADEKKARKRLAELHKDEEFTAVWREALRVVVEETPGLAVQGWFSLNWFLGKGKPGNLPGYIRCLNKEFEWHNKDVVIDAIDFYRPVAVVPGNPNF